jgi:hypothetical protein
VKIRRPIAIGSTVLALVLALVSLARGNLVPLEGLWAIAFGWLAFIRRVFPRVTPTRSGLVMAAVCLGALAVGLHGFFGWFYRNVGRPQGSQGAGTRRWRERWTASILGVVLLMFVAGIAAAGVAHQVVWLVGERDQWTEFRPFDSLAINNLKQTGLSLLELSAAKYSPPAIPPAAKFDTGGQPLHGWMTLILPYGTIRTDHIDLDIAWNDPRNAPNFKAFIPDYLNPAVRVVRDREGYGLSHYAGNVHVLGRTPRTLVSLPNGASNTLLVGEAAARFKPWGQPLTERDPTAGLNTTPDGFASPTGGPVMFLFVDGSVRRVEPGVDPHILRAMAGLPAPPQ